MGWPPRGSKGSVHEEETRAPSICSATLIQSLNHLHLLLAAQRSNNHPIGSEARVSQLGPGQVANYLMEVDERLVMFQRLIVIKALRRCGIFRKETTF
jgi:hypothetical protein